MAGVGGACDAGGGGGGSVGYVHDFEGAVVTGGGGRGRQAPEDDADRDSGSGGNEQVKKWYADKVDFPVRVPQLCKQAACTLRGGRLASIGDKQAAYLVYDVNGDKVSVFIFDASDLPIETRRKTVIDNREVYFDQEHGYNVALFRDRGVGYAIASDMDQEQMVKMVSSSLSP